MQVLERHTDVTRLLLIPFLLAMASLALAACGSDDAASAPVTDPAMPTLPPPISVELLEGREFLSTSVDGYELVEGTTIRLTFDADSLSANAGCNTIFGGYRISEGRLLVDQLGTTEMACERELMDQDRWVTDILSLEPRLTLDGSTLTVQGAGGAVLVFEDREVADPDRPLEGTRWVVDGIISDEAVSSIPGGVVASVTFEDDRALVEAGCNTGSAPIEEITDDTITFGPLGLTKMLCPDDQMQVEAAVGDVLDGEVTYEIEAGRLILQRDGAGLMLVADES